MNLEQIKQRAANATPGPWVATGLRPRLSVADAEFIAHAREDIPALVARVEELEAALRDADAAIESWRTTEYRFAESRATMADLRQAEDALRVAHGELRASLPVREETT